MTNDLASSPGDHSPDDGSAKDRTNWARDVVRHLDELPGDQRVAIGLVYASGLSNREAAARVDVAVGALNLSLAAGIRTLGLALLREARTGRER